MAPKPDGTHEQRPNRTTRRCLLAGVGVAVTTATAGCSGDGNNDGRSEDGDDGKSSSDSPDTSEGGGSSADGNDDTTSDSNDDTDSSESGGGSDCPDPSSFEYVEQVLGDEVNALPSVRFEIPESSEVRQPSGLSAAGLTMTFAGGELTMSVIPTGLENISLEEFAEGATGEESTAQYDFAAEGARSWTLSSSGEVPIRIEVYVQDDEQVSGLRVGTISSNPTGFCPETINGILAHIVESFELA